MRALVAVMTPIVGLALACSDPTFDVTIRYEELAVPAEQQLAPHVVTLTVSVVDAVAAGPAAGLEREATCDDVAFGRIPEDVLEGARRASVAALDTPHLSGVPRLGAKLVVAEARTFGGRRVGGGCTPVGDVESDTTVDVPVEIAPRVRVFARDEIGSEPSPMRIVVTAPWNDLLPLADRRVVAELHSTGGVIEMPVPSTESTGVTQTPDFSLSDPGPAQTIIRVRWADEPLRVPAFVQWPSMQVALVPSSHVSLAADDGSRLARSWVSGVTTINGVTAWGAAALQKRTIQPDEEVVVVRYNSEDGDGTGPGRLVVATPIAVPGARAIALWQGQLYSITPGGWNRITAAGLSPIGGTASGAGSATEIHAFEGCGAAPGTGLIVRRRESSQPDAVERFYAYSAPGTPASTGDLLANLADRLVPGTDEIVGQACVNLGDAPVRIVATRGNALGLAAWLSNGEKLVLNGVQNATSFERGGASFLAAAEGTISGPRVASYKLTNLPLGNMTVTGFVAVDGVDTELATLPLSLVVDELDQDDEYDVLAALPGVTGPRIQANFGRMVAGEQLASISPALPGGRQAANPILRLENVDGVANKELVIMTDEGLDVLCFDVRPGANGSQCASSP